MAWVETAVGAHLPHCTCARCSARQGWDGRARIDAMKAEHERRMVEHEAQLDAEHERAMAKAEADSNTWVASINRRYDTYNLMIATFAAATFVSMAAVRIIQAMW